MLRGEEVAPVFKTKIRFINFDEGKEDVKNSEDVGFVKECLLAKIERGVAVLWGICTRVSMGFILSEKLQASFF